MVACHPGYHWTDSKIRVHAFVCVLGLLLLKLLQHVAKQNGLSMSCKVLIEELEEITMVILVHPGRQTTRKITTLSRVQQGLFDMFGLGRYT